MNIMANVAAYLLDIPSSRDNRKNLLKPDIEYHLDTLPTQLKVDTGRQVFLRRTPTRLQLNPRPQLPRV